MCCTCLKILRLIISEVLLITLFRSYLRNYFDVKQKEENKFFLVSCVTFLTNIHSSKENTFCVPCNYTATPKFTLDVIISDNWGNRYS